MNRDYWKGKDVLVTGGAGFIGSHLVTALCDAGARVRVLDNLTTGSWKNLEHIKHNRPALVCGSICDDHTDFNLKEVKYVFHLAARPSVPRSIDDPRASHEVNVEGSLNLLMKAVDGDVKAFVNTSSSSVHGSLDMQRKRIQSPYALQKKMIEDYVDLFARLYRFPGATLRPFNVFGPRQSYLSPYSAVIPRFLAAAMAGNDLELFGDGSATRDFTYVDNLIDLYLRLGEKLAKNPHEYRGFVGDAGLGRGTTIARLAWLILNKTGSKSIIRAMGTRRGDIKNSVAETADVGDMLDSRYDDHGYESGAPGLIGLEEGLDRTIEWWNK